MFSLQDVKSADPVRSGYQKKRVQTYRVPELVLGKNVVAIKVWLVERMRRDLQVLADHVGLNLSQYAREITISRLLGHGSLPYRREMLEAVPLPFTHDWCEGKSVPMRQAAEGESHLHAEGEYRFE